MSLVDPVDLLLASFVGRQIERAAMQLQMCARRLLAAAFGVLSLTCATGIANADPEGVGPPPVPGLIEQLITQTPVLDTDPADEGGRMSDWGGVGMSCQNPGVRCR
jgi:hypothetical protein